MREVRRQRVRGTLAYSVHTLAGRLVRLDTKRRSHTTFWEDCRQMWHSGLYVLLTTSRAIRLQSSPSLNTRRIALLLLRPTHRATIDSCNVVHVNYKMEERQYRTWRQIDLVIFHTACHATFQQTLSTLIGFCHPLDCLHGLLDWTGLMHAYQFIFTSFSRQIIASNEQYRVVSYRILSHFDWISFIFIIIIINICKAP